MKFDYIVGNPPYQDETLGENKGYAPPVYHDFIDAVYQLSDKVMLIHPARFLFNAGSTPKEWNQKMLDNPHLKVIHYEPDSSNIFPNTDIKGGVAITYYDKTKNFTPIEIFTQYQEVNNIIKKIKNSKNFIALSTITLTSYAYHFTDKMHKDFPNAVNMLSSGHAYDLKSNVFERLPIVFTDKMPDDGNKYIKIIGRKGSERKYKFIRRDYINNVSNLDKYKVFIPKANGAGIFGEALSPPILGVPGTGSTETFLSIGSFDTYHEAQAALTYTKTKFVRLLLGVLKTTQDITPQKWQYVPLQDFTTNSDIDWSKSIPEIDRQLYKKYGLDESEIKFIESHVKEME